MRYLLLAVVTTTGIIFVHNPVWGQVLKTKDVALQNAFAGSTEVQRNVIFLTEEQVQEIQKLAKAEIKSKIVTFYRGVKNNITVGFAFFETSIVRTKPATLIIVLKPDGSVNYIEVLAFYEPFDYLPTEKWFELFSGKILDRNLWPKRGIHNITGATLSVQAITRDVRKILAIYKIAIANEKLN